MQYKNAQEVLPARLLAEIQQYLQGGYLYIPAAKGRRKAWGEQTGTREEIRQRNRNIVHEHQNGASVEELAERYFLSAYSIRKIIYKNR